MSKYQSPLLFVLLLFFSIPVLAQYQLSGKLVDREQQPVAYANVVLFNAVDSTTVITGSVSSEDGSFLFEDLPAEDYLLRISFVGFKNYQQRVSLPEDGAFETIVLEEAFDGLDEVSIRVKRPRIVKQVDRLVFEVENTSLSSGSSWDILRKTPMVVVSNDRLQVHNQAAVVYINDRKVHLSASELKTLLENYSAENIQSVEVITTPPARYDAEGGAILNIVTSGRISPGYKGSVNGSYTQAIYPKYSLGTSHYFKSDKMDLFANYSFNPKKIFKEDDSYINFIEGGQIRERWVTDFDRTTRSNAHNANLMLDYSLDDRNSLSFSANALLSPNQTSDIEVFTQILNPQGDGISEMDAYSDLEEDLSNIGMSLDFNRQLDKEGAEFSAKLHYTYYDQARNQFLHTEDSGSDANFDNSSTLISDGKHRIDIFTAQIDYFTPIGSSNFETGLKTSGINSDSGMNYLFDEPDIISIEQDEFLYDEHILAGYVSLSRDWEHWSLKAGLRGEFTNRKGENVTQDQVDQKEHFDLFPTFYLMHTLNPNHSFSFDYSRRIARPRYESLNPFRYYMNEFSFNEGNPDLKAAISNNFNLNYTLKGQYSFDLYYRDNGPRPEVVSFQDNNQRFLRNVSINMLESLSYGLDITHGRPLTSWWYAYTYMSFFHEEQTFLAQESGDVPVTNEIDAYYGMLGSSFTLSRDGSFTSDLSLIYVSDWITGSYNLDPMTTLSLGFRKRFWDNRAELSLHFEDILNQTNTRMSSRYLNQDNSFFAHPESRYVRLGFKYNFGNFRLQDNQRALDAEERERI